MKSGLAKRPRFDEPTCAQVPARYDPLGLGVSVYQDVLNSPPSQRTRPSVSRATVRGPSAPFGKGLVAPAHVPACALPAESDDDRTANAAEKASFRTALGMSGVMGVPSFRHRRTECSRGIWGWRVDVMLGSPLPAP